MTITFAASLVIAIAISTSLMLVLTSNQRRQNQTEKLHGSFNKAAVDFNLSIVKQETLRKRVIGLDDTNNKLLFLKDSGNKHDGYLIDLDEIRNCKVKKTYGAISADNLRRKSAEAYVNTIGLKLEYANGAQPLVLPFYDKATDPVFEMRARNEQVKEWQALLATRLTGKTNKIAKRENAGKRTYAARIEEATAFVKH